MRLKTFADTQDGFFTAAQAAVAGYARGQQVFHCKTGNWIRIRRGLFRLPGHADTHRSDLVKWSLIGTDRQGGCAGVISHASALYFHGLIDTPPATVHLSVAPKSQKKFPAGCLICRETYPPSDIMRKSGVSVVTPRRAIRDAMAERSGTDMTLLAERAVARGLVSTAEIGSLGIKTRVAVPGRTTAGPTSRFVLLMVRNDGHYFCTLREQLTTRLQMCGLSNILVDPFVNPEDVMNQLARAIALNPTGLLISNDAINENADTWGGYLKVNYPQLPKTVLLPLSNDKYAFGVDVVASDFRLASYKATRWLAEQGRRRIALMTHEYTFPASGHRHSTHCKYGEGYRRALQEMELGNELNFLCGADETDNNRRFAEFLAAECPDAILADFDYRIIQRLGVIKTAGLRVPEDIALFGCYNTPWSHSPHCQFPSVSLREDEIARVAVECLATPGARHSIHTVEPELVIRGLPRTSNR